MANTWTHDPGFVAVIAVALVLAAGFIYGTVRNRRLLEEYLRALQPVILRYARKASARRLGTSGYRVITRDVKPPFRNIDVLIYVQPREILPYWLFNLARGRGDRVYLQVSLRRPPRLSLQTGRVEKEPEGISPTVWQEVTPSPLPGPLYVAGDLDAEALNRLEELAGLLPGLEHLSVRHTSPHVSLVVPARVLTFPERVEKALRLLARF